MRQLRWGLTPLIALAGVNVVIGIQGFIFLLHSSFTLFLITTGSMDQDLGRWMIQSSATAVVSLSATIIVAVIWFVLTSKVAAIEPCRILSPRLMRAVPAISNALSGLCAEHVDVEWIEGSDEADTVAALRPAKGGAARIDVEWVPGPDASGSVVCGFHTITKAGRLHPVWGATEVRIDLPIPLDVPIGSFFQGNRHLIGPLFERVVELVGSDGVPVYDLHAGVGYLAAAARHAGERELTLVEPNREAAFAARRNLPGAQVVVGSTAEAFVTGARNLPSESIVITDPPRTGLSKDLRNRLARWQPQRILMLGCDPATWARDAGFLSEHGYQPTVVEIFDLFPSTHHLEILALLERA